MRKILITNDDGIRSDGIIRLAEAAKSFGEVYVVAPDSQRSSMSHSVTLNRDFMVWESDFPVDGVHAYACSATPADCVRIGVLNIVPDGVDNVFSGINFGYNSATDIQYSATVGAAFEAAFQKIHAIAFSEDTEGVHEVTEHYLHDIIAELINKPLSENQIWNVNFPCCRLSECHGILRDRKVSNDVFYRDSYEMHQDEEGRYVCHVLGNRSYIAADGTDLRALYDNYVSIGVVNNVS